MSNNGFRVLPLKNYEDTHLITSDGRVFRKTKIGGDDNHFTRIPEMELPKIKEMYAGGYSQKQIAGLYKVDQSHISRIVNNHRRGRITQCQI